MEIKVGSNPTYRANEGVYQLVEMTSARGCSRSPVKDRNAAGKTSADGSSPSILTTQRS